MAKKEGDSPSTLERAFQLADAGMKIRDIRMTLNREGFKDSQLQGRALIRQLEERGRAVRAKA